MELIEVVLLSTDPLSGAGLTALLAEQENVEIVQQLVGELALLNEIDAEDADVLLWDTGWESNDFPITSFPLPTVALLAADSNPTILFQIGVEGILSRMADSDSITAALFAVVNGLTVIDDGFRNKLLVDTETTVNDPHNPLTSREQDVLELVAEGLANKAIAQTLNISTHTVKFHLNAIMGKLNAQSRTEAVVIATRHGLLSL